MPRMRGPTQARPSGPTLLNQLLFGDNAVGGPTAEVRPEALPVDWEALFGRAAPRTLEIGFNRGRFLSELAARWPDHDHLGIEIRRRYCWRLANQLDASQALPNVRLVWGDAKRVSPALFPQGGLAAVFVNFPDPWWKRKHAKRRLVQPDYAAHLRDLLAMGGQVWVKSDVPAIADEIDAALASTPGLSGPTPFEEGDLPLTYREVKCLAAGMPIYRFRYQRVAQDQTPDAQSTTNT